MLNIQDFMNSQEIKDIVKHITNETGLKPYSAMGRIIETAIMYGRIHGNDGTLNFDGVEDVLRMCFNNIKGKDIAADNRFFNECLAHLVDDYLAKEGITEELKNNPQLLEKEIAKFSSKIISNTFIYHGTNSNHLPQILENGLDPNAKTREINDGNRIRSALQEFKYGPQWSDQFESEVFYSDVPKYAYEYGLISPEWFSYYCGRGYNYMQRNYEDSLAAFSEKLSQHYNMSEPMKNQMISLFNDAWNFYANGKPIIFVIPSNLSPAEIQDEINNTTSYAYDNKSLSARDMFVQALSFTIPFGGVDNSTTEKIDISNATILTLPSYDEINFSRNNARQNKFSNSSSILHEENGLML